MRWRPSRRSKSTKATVRKPSRSPSVGKYTFQPIIREYWVFFISQTNQFISYVAFILDWRFALWIETSEFTHLCGHWKSHEEETEADGCGNLFPVGQELLGPVVHDSSDQWLNAAELRVNPQHLKCAMAWLPNRSKEYVKSEAPMWAKKILKNS